MAGASFRFDCFELDPGNRRLCRDGAPVELNARYLDALVLLAAEQGRLVSKDRFLDEVWRGIPVTDEALTQCIKTLRRQLGDDAANPRFIETVPKHGYRFLAAVEVTDGEPGQAAAASVRTDSCNGRAKRGSFASTFTVANSFTSLTLTRSCGGSKPRVGVIINTPGKVFGGFANRRAYANFPRK